MAGNKRNVAIFIGVLAALASVYALHRDVRQRSAAQPHAQQPLGAPAAKKLSIPAAVDSSRYLHDGPPEDGPAASGRAVNAVPQEKTGPGADAASDDLGTREGTEKAGNDPAADAGKITPMARSAGEAPPLSGNARTTRTSGPVPGRSSAATPRDARSSARTAANPPGRPTAGGQRGALGTMGKNAAGRTSKRAPGAQGTADALASVGITGDNAAAVKAAAGNLLGNTVPSDSAPSPVKPPSVSDSGDEDAVDLGCNNTRAYCNTPVFVRSWQKRTGDFVGVAYAAGRGCCVYFCAHTRYWWHGKDAQHHPVFDDSESDPGSPYYSDGAVGKFCAFSGLASPGRCSCSLNMLKVGDTCYGQIPASSCGLPVTVTVPGWKTVYVCKGRPAYCTGR